MNLTRVLDVALPELPARIISERAPRIPPDVVFKEHIEEGKPIVRVLVPGQDAMYRFPKANWELAQLFDGNRSYEEIATMYSAQAGVEYSIEEIREFAESLEADEFWYKTAQEKNILLMQKDAQKRRKALKAKKSKWGDLAQITFPAVNPDKFLTWVHKLHLVHIHVVVHCRHARILRDHGGDHDRALGRNRARHTALLQFFRKELGRRRDVLSGRLGGNVLARNRPRTRMQALRRSGFLPWAFF